jgi:hypothetical protein
MLNSAPALGYVYITAVRQTVAQMEWLTEALREKAAKRAG